MEWIAADRKPMSAKMYSTPRGTCMAALSRPHSVSIFDERLVGEGEARRGHDDGGDDPQRDEELRPGEQLVEDLEHDVAVAADEVAGRDEGHRDHRHERELAGADPADRGEVAPQDLVHDAEDDEGEQRDADRDLDRGEDPDEPRVRGTPWLSLGAV